MSPDTQSFLTLLSGAVGMGLLMAFLSWACRAPLRNYTVTIRENFSKCSPAIHSVTLTARGYDKAAELAHGHFDTDSLFSRFEVLVVRRAGR